MSESDKVETPILSTGQPSTLGTWYLLSVATFGPQSKASKFLQDKIDKQGIDEPVLSDEGQLIYALWMIDQEANDD